MVAAAIRTVFAQPGPVPVVEQLDTVATMLGREFPKVESMLREPEAFCAIAQPGSLPRTRGTGGRTRAARL